MNKQRGQAVVPVVLISFMIAVVIIIGIQIVRSSNANIAVANLSAEVVADQADEWVELFMDSFGTHDVSEDLVVSLSGGGYVAKPPVEWPGDNSHLDAHGFSTAAMWARCTPNAMLRRSSDGRWAMPCEIDDEWYVFIAEAIDDATGKMRGVTGFRNRGRTLEDVIRYLLQRGYGL